MLLNTSFIIILLLRLICTINKCLMFVKYILKLTRLNTNYFYRISCNQIMKDYFDFIIIDEAAQATEPESLLPIGHALVKNCFIYFLLSCTLKYTLNCKWINIVQFLQLIIDLKPSLIIFTKLVRFKLYEFILEIIRYALNVIAELKIFNSTS